jgi:hypothetical protein
MSEAASSPRPSLSASPKPGAGPPADELPIIDNVAEYEQVLVQEYASRCVMRFEGFLHRIKNTPLLDLDVPSLVSGNRDTMMWVVATRESAELELRVAGGFFSTDSYNSLVQNDEVLAILSRPSTPGRAGDAITIGLKTGRRPSRKDPTNAACTFRVGDVVEVPKQMSYPFREVGSEQWHAKAPVIYATIVAIAVALPGMVGSERDPVELPANWEAAPAVEDAEPSVFLILSCGSVRRCGIIGDEDGNKEGYRPLFVVVSSRSNIERAGALPESPASCVRRGYTADPGSPSRAEPRIPPTTTSPSSLSGSAKTFTCTSHGASNRSMTIQPWSATMTRRVRCSSCSAKP